MKGLLNKEISQRLELERLESGRVSDDVEGRNNDVAITDKARGIAVKCQQEAIKETEKAMSDLKSKITTLEDSNPNPNPTLTLTLTLILILIGGL